MKTKKVLIALAVAALVVCLILITARAFWVLIALIAGSMIMGHRELWSLIRTGKMPPVDERVKENTGKSIRNAFVCFAIVSIVLMLAFSIKFGNNANPAYIVSGLFFLSGAIYLLSYIFYDRAEPNLGERALNYMRIFLATTGTALAVFIISFFLHNVVSGLIHREEALFFIIAVIVSPLAFATGIIGSLTIFIKGLVKQPRDRSPEGSLPE